MPLMNMERVKTLVIVFLLLLNVVLFALNWQQTLRYQLTSEQETAITTLLLRNHIRLEQGVSMRKNFAPMPQIELAPFHCDILHLTRALFDSSEILAPLSIEDDGKIRTKVQSGQKSLVVTGSGFAFDNPPGFGGSKEPVIVSEATALCAGVLERLYGQSSEYRDLRLVLDYVSPVREEGYCWVEYRSDYRDYTVYSSYMRFKVGPGGIEQIRASLYLPQRFAEGEREIYSTDEALYALLQEIRNIYGGKGEEILIRRMDMVYYVVDAPEDETAIKADPYYRMYLSNRPEQPVLINAYTNTVAR